MSRMSNEHKYCIGKDDHSWKLSYNICYQQVRADVEKELQGIKLLGALYSEIRNDTIDEFVKALEKHQTRQDSYLEPPYVEMGLDMTDVLEVAEKLKER